MKKKYFITCNEAGNFFLNGYCIDGEWYDFFGRLPMEKEKYCAEIFIKRYAKKLLKKYENG